MLRLWIASHEPILIHPPVPWHLYSCSFCKWRFHSHVGGVLVVRGPPKKSHRNGELQWNPNKLSIKQSTMNHPQWNLTPHCKTKAILCKTQGIRFFCDRQKQVCLIGDCWRHIKNFDAFMCVGKGSKACTVSRCPYGSSVLKCGCSPFFFACAHKQTNKQTSKPTNHQSCTLNSPALKK